MQLHDNDRNSSPAPTQPRLADVTFSGKAGEFFGIWIVNLLLTIVTLGIYSARAKVRTNQYFYGHTQIEGHSFRYLATPMQILRGRLIAGAFFLIYMLCTAFVPLVGAVLALALIPLMPWMMISGLRFHLRMTSYRNVRFAFHGSYLQGLLHFVVLPVLGVLSLGLALPWVLKKIDQFIHGSTSYGGRQLVVETHAGAYYLAMLAALGGAIVVSIIFFVGAIVLASGMGDSDETSAMGAMLGSVSIVVWYLLLFIISGSIYQSIIRNHLFNNSEIPDVAQLESNLKFLPWIVLTLTNALALIFSFGLAYPWTRIRKTAYLASVTSLLIEPAADSVIDTVQQSISSIGEEAAGFFDVDVSLG